MWLKVLPYVIPKVTQLLKQFSFHRSSVTVRMMTLLKKTISQTLCTKLGAVCLIHHILFSLTIPKQ